MHDIFMDLHLERARKPTIVPAYARPLLNTDKYTIVTIFNYISLPITEDIYSIQK